jgi:hypothetical protein
VNGCSASSWPNAYDAKPRHTRFEGRLDIESSCRTPFISATPADTRWLDKTARFVTGRSSAQIALDGGLDIALAPLALTQQPLAVAVLMPNSEAYDTLSDPASFFAVVLFTILATIAAGLPDHYLIQPRRFLTRPRTSLRFAGRAPPAWRE